MNATQLRQNLYQTLDAVIETGETVRIERKGKVLLLTPEEKPVKKRVFKKRRLLLVPDEEIIHMDWSKEWRYEK